MLGHKNNQEIAKDILKYVFKKEFWTTVAIVTSVAFALYAIYSIVSWWKSRQLPKYNIIQYNPDTFEQIAEKDVKELNQDAKYLFLNQKDKEQLDTKFLDSVDLKIDQNKNNICFRKEINIIFYILDIMNMARPHLS